MRLVSSVVMLFALVFGLSSPVRAAGAGPLVYYAGPEGAVKTALQLAQFSFTPDPAAADVLVFNGQLPDGAAAAQRLRAGAGLLLILGPEVRAEQLGSLLGVPVALQTASQALTLEQAPGEGGRLRQVVWNTAPQVIAHTRFSAPDGSLPAGLQPWIVSHESGEAVIAAGAGGRLLLVSAQIDGDNQQFREWGYFNYLVYSLAMQAAGREPLSFAAYPASPVPHPEQQRVLFLAMAVLLLISLASFYVVRRYSLAHPEALDTLVLNPKAFAAKEAGTDWEKIGFHRPLGGFMFALMMGLFLFIPLTVYSDMILPVYILPSAQAFGIFGRVAAFFPLIWSLFDMGTSVAHMKYFSEYRVKNPRRAIQYAQFYVWWQALTGAVQVALVVIVVGAFVPQSVYALYAWAIITHTLIQIPGFYRLFTDAFSGIQRSDYGTILDMGINLVFPMLTKAVFVTLLVWWGRSHPIYGQSMGGVFGLGVAAYATELVSFIFGWFLYRRLGYHSGLLMMAHFTKEVMWESLRYGLFLFLSGLVGGLGSAIYVLVVQNRLLNNNEIMGNMGLASSFVFAFTVFQALTGAMMPSISEAFANGRKILAQYYVTNGYKYGGMLSGFLCAILLAVADRFILGSSGPSFARAAVYVVPLVFSGALQFAYWNAEMVIYGSGKTSLFTLILLIDTLLSVGLSFLLVDRFQATALLAVPFVTTPIRILLSYWLIDRYCFPQRVYPWQTIVAPLLAGGGHYLVLRLLTGLIWRQDELSSILILVVALIPSYPLYAFLYGLAGGWDADSLAVFDRGTRLTSFMRPFTRLYYQATALGARLSPLHGRFPLSNHAAAMAEAESLTAERVSLVKPDESLAASGAD